MPINALTAGVAALAINSTAFTIEIFRGGFAAVPVAQHDFERRQMPQVTRFSPGQNGQGQTIPLSKGLPKTPAAPMSASATYGVRRFKTT